MASWPPEKKAKWWASLSSSDRQLLAESWRFVARGDQVQPAWPYKTWFICAGRGWGKTRTGSETIHEWAAEGGVGGRMFLVGRTAADVRDVMIEGESGILEKSKKGNIPRYNPSKRQLTWPSGVIAKTYSADEPDQFRGPQHHRGWADELAAWHDSWGCWQQLMLGLRLRGWEHTRCIVTTTPRPVRVIRDLLARSQVKAGDAATVHYTRGTTYDNLHNLDDTFKDEILSQYEGTRMGRQELEAEILDDTPGALWKRAWFDREGFRLVQAPPLLRVGIGVDPPAKTAHCGIIAAGLGEDGEYYVMADHSIPGTPETWGRQVVTAYNTHQADRIVPEVNNGGEMVSSTIRTVDPKVPIRPVHASRGKLTRAEPISALYEQGKVHHVGVFADLEDEMCTYDGTGTSPDRMDALVWVLTDLRDHAPRKRPGGLNPRINTPGKVWRPDG